VSASDALDAATEQVCWWIENGFSPVDASAALRLPRVAYSWGEIIFAAAFALLTIGGRSLNKANLR